jgi:uncharacterized protein
MSHALKFSHLPGHYAVVRFAPDAPVPAWAAEGGFISITRTRDELSIVCAVENIPPDVHFDPSWICLKLEGPFPFSQTGVLLSFIAPLSSNNVPIFTISTFDTDYVLIPQEHASRAVHLLRAAGHAPV